MTKFASEFIAEQKKIFDNPELDISIWVAEACGNYYLALDYIEHLQARVQELEQERRWIPVSERLPELFQPVIVSGERDQKFVNEEIAWISMFFDDGEPNWTCWHVKNVTKWRPYQPPESEEE